MTQSNASVGAPGILPDACLLFDDLIDQLIDGGNARSAMPQSTTGRSRKSRRNRHQTTFFTESFASSLGNGDEGTVESTTESTVSKTSARSSTCSEGDSRFIIDLKDLDSALVYGDERDRGKRSGSTSYSNATPSKDTYRTLCSRIEDDESESTRPESLYRSSTAESRCAHPASMLADALGYTIPSHSRHVGSATAATSTVTPIIEQSRFGERRSES